MNFLLQPGGDWSECGEVAGDETDASITDVEEGKEYEFRVSAVNAAGPSEPSDPSDPVVCLDKPGE